MTVSVHPKCSSSGPSMVIKAVEVIIGQKEGVCKLFAEMSWEHQEDTLCQGIQNVPAVEAIV